MVDPKDPYRAVLFALLVATLVGVVVAFAGGLRLGNPVLIDAAVALELAAGVLVGVAMTLTSRGTLLKKEAAPPESAVEAQTSAVEGQVEAATPAGLRARLAAVIVRARAWRWYSDSSELASVITAGFGTASVLFVLLWDAPSLTLLPVAAGIAAALILAAAGLAATVAVYLADADPARFPEAPWLCRGARVVAWILVLAAVATGLMWAGHEATVHVIHLAVLTVVAAMCFSLFRARRSPGQDNDTFPLDFPVLAVLGSRPNLLASALDSAEQQLGIDLRSTWALTIVRRGLEPLAVGLCLFGWLSTTLTVVKVEEQALVENLGVPSSSPPLEPGLHLHWPWPIARVFRIPTQSVQTVHVGHEGEEEPGPEDVLWARQHAANEFTLLLGDGRDLITIDAAVQFRIIDAKAWRYHTQNPADALKAISYRAVMRSTVNLTLAQALSQDMATLTRSMGLMVQQDANTLGLGVEVIAFTVGGMHPPVPVAAAYQAVGSSELGKVTSILNANTYRNRNVPGAEASVYSSLASARGQAALDLARAAGEAESFRLLDHEFRDAHEDYSFRQRLEALEQGLSRKRFTVVDARFLRDGGVLWISP